MTKKSPPLVHISLSMGMYELATAFRQSAKTLQRVVRVMRAFTRKVNQYDRRPAVIYKGRKPTARRKKRR